MNYARNIEIIRKHTFMITKKICILPCFKCFLCARHSFLTKVIFIQRTLKNIQGLPWKIKRTFQGYPTIFQFSTDTVMSSFHILLSKPMDALNFSISGSTLPENRPPQSLFPCIKLKYCIKHIHLFMIIIKGSWPTSFLWKHRQDMPIFLLA